jgi:hypothetical protein
MIVLHLPIHRAFVLRDEWAFAPRANRSPPTPPNHPVSRERKGPRSRGPEKSSCLRARLQPCHKTARVARFRSAEGRSGGAAGTTRFAFLRATHALPLSHSCPVLYPLSRKISQLALSKRDKLGNSPPQTARIEVVDREGKSLAVAAITAIRRRP